MSHNKHETLSAEAKRRRGEWVDVGTYGSLASARAMCNHIRTAKKLHAYAPPRSFDAEWEHVRGTGWVVRVKYL